MDPDETFRIMRDPEATKDESRQAACDLYNWLTKAGYPVNGWSVEQCKAECKKYMR